MAGDEMVCYHCPGKTFANMLVFSICTSPSRSLTCVARPEFEEHRKAHTQAQQELRRRPYRTYGGRSDPRPTTRPTTRPPTQSTGSSLGPILPMTNNEIEIQNAQIADPQPDKDVQGTLSLSRVLAEFMDSDKTYLFFRRFAKLNIQHLLQLQSELVTLEKEITGAATNEATGKDNITHLRKLIGPKLDKYNEALFHFSTLSDFRSPKQVSVSDLRQWARDIEQENDPLVSFLKENPTGETDLISLSRNLSKKTHMYELVEKLTWRLFTTPIAGGKRIALPKGGTLLLFDDSMVQRVHRAVLTILMSLVLLIPIIILASIEGERTVAIAVALCTAGMAVLLAVVTDCRDHEIIMAASAYAAVLIVYVK
ncbi:hypothetical protein FQN57_004930 [Myotisia sp. PD_48]|nr:hypothetical protein FQN57_004930 [Myotisia sp. PD_48]